MFVCVHARAFVYMHACVRACVLSVRVHSIADDIMLEKKGKEVHITTQAAPFKLCQLSNVKI